MNLLIIVFISLACAETQTLTKTDPCTFITLTLTGEKRDVLYKYRDVFVIESTVNVTAPNINDSSRMLKLSMTPGSAISTYAGINPSQEFYKQFVSNYYGSYRSVKNKLSKEIDLNFRYYINICAEFETSNSNVSIIYDNSYTFVHKTEFNTKHLGWIIPLCIAGLCGIILVGIHAYEIIKRKLPEPLNLTFST